MVIPKKANSEMPNEVKNLFSMFFLAGKGSAQLCSLAFSSRAC